jgi:transcriptional regulator with XRE-family HTH domain
VQELRIARAEAGMTLMELEAASGVGASTISKIERGVTQPQVGTLRKLAQALGVEVEDFFREPAVPLAEAPPPSGPPRVSKDRLQEHFDDVRQEEVDYLNWIIADLWRLALPGQKPVARFVSEEIDTARAWSMLQHALGERNVFAPEQVERIQRGALKLALTGGAKDS